MKIFLLLVVLLFISAGNSYSQITNLVVNSSSSSFTMASGDQISWSYDVPHPDDTNVNINLTQATDVKQVNSNIPKTFALSQNFPNPFNPTTQIQYDIPKSSFVNLVVYNMLGQKIADLVNSLQVP